MLILTIFFSLLAIGFCEKSIIINEDDFTRFREPPLPKSKSASPFDIKLEWIEQRVDNFDPQNNETYLMRYYRNDEFFKPGAPIFIYIGGEWAISSGWIRGGHMYEMAKELNGQMYYTEHRFYGESLPKPNASTENLKYLSIEQALADLAHFVVEKKKETGRENSKVIVVGASYSATMAAWFRQKYPHLVAGAWASSGPVFAKVEMSEYKEVVGAAVRQVGGQQCYDRLDNAFKDAGKLVENRNFDKLKQLFRICDSSDLTRQENIWRTFGSLSGILSGTVQYHQTGDIEGDCDELLSGNGTDLEEFARWYLSQIFDEDEEGCLTMDYDSYVKRYQTIDFSEEEIVESRVWLYQTCTEFGWFQTSATKYQPFGTLYPMEYNYMKCEDIFGKGLITPERLDQAVERKNSIYGGLNPSVNNVYFTHGKLDPWRTMGIQYDTDNPLSPVDIISTSAHCQDLYGVNELGEDTEEMLAVKSRIKVLVREWLK